MSVYTQISSDDIIITQETVSSPAWPNGNSIFVPSYGGGSTPHMFGTDGGKSTDFALANVGYQGYTERDIGYNQLVCGYTVYDRDKEDPSAVQIANLIYANKLGSASYWCNINESAEKSSLTRGHYGKFRSLVYGDENTNFQFNGHEPNDIWIISLNRIIYKEGITPENLMLLVGNADSDRDTYLTTDVLSNLKPPKITNLGRQYNIVSGSYGYMDGTNLNQSTNSNSGSYGLFYPDAGVMIFNPDAFIDEGILAGADLSNYNTYKINNSTSFNQQSLISIIWRILFSPASNDTTSGYFELKSEETLFSQNYLIRVPNERYNYTNNQTFVDEKGKLKNLSFVDNPVTYITTVGLYNDQNELLAVAKLSKPLLKDFSKELFIKVKLDF